MQIIREQKLMFGERTKFLISEDTNSPVWASALPTPPHHLRAIRSNFFIFSNVQKVEGFPGGARGKEPTCNAGDIRDAVLIPGLGRCTGGGNGNPLHYSCLENPTDRGAWPATIHRVTKSGTGLKQLSKQHAGPIQDPHYGAGELCTLALGLHELWWDSV